MRRAAALTCLVITACVAGGILLSGCDAGSLASAVIQHWPPTLNLSANPETITAGQTTTLTWGSTNADSVVNSTFGATTVSGVQIVSPVETTTYQITVRGDGGTKTATVTVTVTAG